MNKKFIIEGFISFAVAAILLLVFLYVPILGLIAPFFFPVPFVYHSAKYRWKGAILLILIFIISALIDFRISLSFVLFYGLIGTAMGISLSYYKDRLTTFVASTLTAIFAIFLILGLNLLLFNVNLINEFTEGIKQSVIESIDIIESLGQTLQPNMMEFVTLIIDTIIAMIPTFIVLLSVVNIVIIQWIAFPILRRMGILIPSGKPLREISLPKSIIWYFLLTMILSFFIPAKPGSFLYNVIINLSAIFQFLFVFQGVTFILFICHKKNLHKVVSIILAVLSVSNPIFLQITQIIGIIDLGFSLKKRMS